MSSARVAFGLLLLSSAAAAQQYVISTFAGGGAPATPSVAVDAAIGTPLGVATDAAGNVYFASPDLNSVFKLRQQQRKPFFPLPHRFVSEFVATH